jgi:hypothetical protein
VDGKATEEEACVCRRDYEDKRITECRGQNQMEWLKNNVLAILSLIISGAAFVIPQMKWYKNKIIELSLSEKQNARNAKFNAQFEAYQSIIKECNKLSIVINDMIPYSGYQTTDNILVKLHEQLMMKSHEQYQITQETIIVNSIFVPTEIRDICDQILSKANEQIRIFCSLPFQNYGSLCMVEKLESTDYNRTKAIFNDLNYLVSTIKKALEKTEYIKGEESA